MRRVAGALAVLSLGSAMVVGAQQADVPKFEVASLRLSDPKSTAMTAWKYDGTDRFVATHTSLKLLIAIAYGMSDNRVEALPGWAEDTNYDVNAKAEDGKLLSDETLQPLLQQLLAERLQVKAHFETRQVKGYALVPGKGKPKLVPSSSPEGQMMILPDGVAGQGMTMVTLADLLSRPLGRPVMDKTGLTGHYDVKLSFAPLNDANSTLPSPSVAIEEQLGLRLETAQVPEKMLVVDHAERVPPAN